MDPENPISLQKSLNIAKDELLKMADYTIRPEKHEEIVKNRAIGGLINNAQEPSDLADQRSKSDRHIVTRDGKQRLPYESCDNDQRESMRAVDQARRSMTQVNSQYHIGKIQGSAHQRPEDYAICDCDIAISHRSDTKERVDTNALDAMKPDPKGFINVAVYYLKSTIKPCVGIFSVLMYFANKKETTAHGHL